MKYIVTLHTTAEMVATVEVKAKNPEQAREKALAMAPEVDFELDSLNYDHVTAEDVEEDE